MQAISTNGSSSSEEEVQPVPPKKQESKVDESVKAFFENPSSQVGLPLLKRFTSGEEKNYAQAFEVAKKLIDMLTHKQLFGAAYPSLIKRFVELEKRGPEELSKPFYGWVLYAITWNHAKNGTKEKEQLAADYSRAATFGCDLAKPMVGEDVHADINKFTAVLEGMKAKWAYVQEELKAKDAEIASLKERITVLTKANESVVALENEVALYKGKLAEAVKIIDDIFPHSPKMD
jgi:hypothetical protein